MSDQIFEEHLQTFLDELKREDEMTEKQRNILKAAIKLFATKGFHATSTSEIAKEAGVAEGTIFRHYKSKKDILIATVAPILIQFAAPFILKDIEQIISEMDDKPIGEIFASLYRNRLELVEANHQHFRIIVQEAFFHEEIRTALIESVLSKGQRIVRMLIERRIAAGELRPLPPDVVVRAVLSFLLGLVVQKFVLPPEGYDKEAENWHIDHTVDILLNGIACK